MWSGVESRIEAMGSSIIKANRYRYKWLDDMLAPPREDQETALALLLLLEFILSLFHPYQSTNKPPMLMGYFPLTLECDGELVSITLQVMLEVTT